MLKDPASPVPKLTTAAPRFKKCPCDMLNVEYDPNTGYTFDLNV